MPHYLYHLKKTYSVYFVIILCLSLLTHPRYGYSVNKASACDFTKLVGVTCPILFWMFSIHVIYLFVLFVSVLLIFVPIIIYGFVGGGIFSVIIICNVFNN